MKPSSRKTRYLLCCKLLAVFLVTGALLINSSTAQEIGQGTRRQATRLLDDAIERLETVPTLSAKIRQRIDLLGESLVGSGAYQQANYGPDSLFRLDLKMPLGANQVSTLFQVGDGRYVWTYRVVPDTSHTPSNRGRTGASEMPLRNEVTLVDLNQVRETGKFGGVTAFGGLPHMLRQISRNYDMESAVRASLQDLPVWKLEGRLKEAAANDDVESDKSTASRGVPQWVFLLLGEDNGFPYRVEFRDQLITQLGSENAIVVSARERQSVAMDFFEVQERGAIDPRVFEFKPPESEPVLDATQQYLAETEN